MKTKDWGGRIRSWCSDRHNQIILIASFLFGFTAHGYAITNKLSYYDDINSLFQLGATWNLGRWNLGILQAVFPKIFGSNNFSTPLFNGILSILLLAVVACILTKLFLIEDKLGIILTAGICICSPFLTGLFGYMFTAPAYSLAALYASIAAYLLVKFENKKERLAAVILIALSAGIYQAFLTFTCTIILVYYLIAALNDRFDKEIKFRRVLMDVLAVGISVICYLVLNKFFLILKHMEMSDYQGLGNMGVTSVSNYIRRIIEAYKLFFIPSLRPDGDYYPGRIVFLYYAVLILILIGMMICTKQISAKSRIISWLFLTLLPMSVDLLIIISDVDYSLTGYSKVIVLLLLIVLIDKVCEQSKYITFKNISVVCLLLLLFLWIRFANICYLKAEFLVEEGKSYYTELRTRIQIIDGYDEEIPVVFLNEQGKSLASEASLPQQFSEIKLNPYAMNDIINDQKWRVFMRDWCGYYPIHTIDEKDFEWTSETNDMPRYPADGSIKIRHDMIIVKF